MTIKSTLSRDYIIKSLLVLLDEAEHHGWWGEVGIDIVIQRGELKTMKKRVEQTDKGGVPMDN